MSNQEEIRSQLKRLEIHRKNLSLLLEQKAALGLTETRLKIANEIFDERKNISIIKNSLRSRGVVVGDLPDDEENKEQPISTTPPIIRPVIISLFAVIILLLFVVSRILYRGPEPVFPSTEVGGSGVTNVTSTPTEDAILPIANPITTTASVFPTTSIICVTKSDAELASILDEAKTIWEKDEDEDKAVSLLNEIIVCSPNYLRAYVQLGRLYIQASDKLSSGQDITPYIDKAIDTLSKTLQINPNYYDGHYNLAIAYYRKPGFIDKAIETMSLAIDIDPRQQGAWKGRGEFYVQRSKGSTTKGSDACSAITDLTKALVLDPSYAGVYYHLGLAHVELGDWDKAKDSYDRFLVLAATQTDVPEVKILTPKVLAAIVALGQRPSNVNPIPCN